MELKVVFSSAFPSLGISESKKVAVVVFTDVKKDDVVIYDVEGIEDDAIDDCVRIMVSGLMSGTNFVPNLIKKVGNVYFYEHSPKKK